MSLDEQDKQWIRNQLEQFWLYVDKRAEQIEKKLLTEFYKRTSPAEARNHAISAALRALDVEMEELTDRVKQLEDNP
jgi:hypothetical protein